MKLSELSGAELCRIKVRRHSWSKICGSMSLAEAIACEAVGSTYDDWHVDPPSAPKWDLLIVALNAAGGAFLGVVVALLTVWWMR